jgi:allophanate hydrolase subunit 2
MQERLLGSTFIVDRASDRMGYRLTGPAVTPRVQATLPSEAACPGAIQVPDNGQPIVIMPDGPTVGGYPKIATVIRADLRLLAQSPPGTAVRFQAVSLEEARRIILLP